MRKKYKKKVTFACFQLLTYENDKTHAKHGIWSNAITLANKSILNLFSLLRTKLTKTYCYIRKRKRLYEKRAFWAFLSYQNMTCFFFINTQKTRFLKSSFLSLLRMLLHAFWRKSSILSVFEILTKINTKIHRKYSRWGNKNTLRETCIMFVLELLRYQKAKTHK